MRGKEARLGTQQLDSQYTLLRLTEPRSVNQNTAYLIIMTTHIGKIARLAKKLREELGRRMADGEPGPSLLKWLNGRRDVKAVLRAQFGGRPVNKQNLCAWRRSGQVEWLKLEEARGRTDRLAEQADDLAKRAGTRGLGDRLAILLALEMDGLMRTLLEPEADPEKRWQRVRELHREVSRLRRDDDRGEADGAAGEAGQGYRPKAERAEGEDEDEARIGIMWSRRRKGLKRRVRRWRRWVGIRLRKATAPQASMRMRMSMTMSKKRQVKMG